MNIVRKKNSKKKVVLIALVALALCKGIDYSILSQSLKFEGTVSVDNGFNVVITGIEKYDWYSKRNTSTNIVL